MKRAPLILAAVLGLPATAQEPAPKAAPKSKFSQAQSPGG
jgi:hypothetical protein